MKRVAIYVRVSTESQAEEDKYSIPHYRKKLVLITAKPANGSSPKSLLILASQVII